MVKPFPPMAIFKPGVLSVTVFSEINYFLIVIYSAILINIQDISKININSFYLLFILLIVLSLVSAFISTKIVITGPKLTSFSPISSGHEFNINQPFEVEARRRRWNTEGNITIFPTYSYIDFYLSSDIAHRSNQHISLGLGWSKNDVIKLFTYLQNNYPNIKQLYFP